MSELTNCASTWFPVLQGSGVPVPQTIVLAADHDALASLLDSDPDMAPVDRLVDAIWQAAQDLDQPTGYPVFLRTGHTSGEFDWSETCYLRDPEDKQAILQHVFNLVDYSHFSVPALDTSAWLVREVLPVAAPFRAFHGRMPIARERRYFFRDGKVVCHHPYWPTDAFTKHTYVRDALPRGWGRMLATLNRQSRKEVIRLTHDTALIAARFPGAWSVDWLYSDQRDTWYAIDMARAEDAWHWPVCPHVQEFKR